MIRVAVVHDWLYVLGGAEKVLSAILRCYPQADVFCLFDVLSAEDRQKAGLPQSKTTFFQRLPAIHRRHRMYLPLMPIAIEQLDLSGYDLIISSSYAVAKGVLTGPDQFHVSYVHSPMRYAWDLQHSYLRESRWDGGIKGAAARWLLHKLRIWDVRTAHGVNQFLANSHFIARRVQKAYGRTATVIWPPVDVPDVLPPPVARPAGHEEPFYFAASRLVPYKNMDAIVQAFASMPNRRLIVAGTGPELQRLQAMSGPNVTFAGFVSDERLRQLMRGAEAFIFAAEEDFGIVPVEVQGEGTPVLALGRGGVRETVVTTGSAPTGLFFDQADAVSIAAAVEVFEQSRDLFTRAACHANALRFQTARFEREFKSTVEASFAAFTASLDAGLPPGTSASGRRVLDQPSGHPSVQPAGQPVLQAAVPSHPMNPAESRP